VDGVLKKIEYNYKSMSIGNDDNGRL